MIVTLSWGQLQAARHWAAPRHRQYLVGNRERTKAGHAVAMPASGWRTLADRLVREAFYPSGRHRKTRNARDGVAATRDAAQRIERSLAELMMHPAVQGQAVRGVSGDVLVVWRTVKGWSIYPVDGVAVSYLVPHTEMRPIVDQVTMWQERTSIDFDVPGAFLDVESHVGWDDAGSVEETG